jgi:hypothetical protein
MAEGIMRWDRASMLAPISFPFLLNPPKPSWELLLVTSSNPKALQKH